MSVFSAPKVGSSEAIGSRYGDISGTSTDIIYPVSKLVGDQYQEGRTMQPNLEICGGVVESDLPALGDIAPTHAHHRARWGVASFYYYAND